MKVHKIAVLAGDGIGKEVMPEGVRGSRAGAATGFALGGAAMLALSLALQV